MRKKIFVVAAIILNSDQIIAMQRGYGEFEGFWEFPGGKIENGESQEVALKREIKEELNIEININRHFDTTDYSYPDFDITLYFYLCEIKSGRIELKEHKGKKWLGKEDLETINWLPADRKVIKKLRDEIFKN